MSKHLTLLAGCAVSALALVSSARADVKLNDNITLSGYAAGAYMNYKASGVPAVDSLFDASKPVPGGGDANDLLTKFTFNYKPVTTVISFNYFPNLTGSEFTVLDAYATYDFGNGFSITGGKFLSYMGYESFYPASMDQISYADNDFLGAIPAYHTGVHMDYTQGAISTGVAALDSVYSPYGPTKGDGELKHNAGFEGYVQYSANGLTLWGGVAHDTKGGFEPHSVTTFDVWSSYQATKDARLGAEFVSKDGGPGAKGTNWIAFLDYSFSGTVSSAFRVSGEEMADGGPKFTKYTVCPALQVTPALAVRVEYSYYSYSNYTSSSANFFGVQSIFKF